MNDCCSQLRAELAALRAEIKNIKIDETAIIKKTEASILPQIPGIVSPIILTNLNPFKSRLGKVENLSGQALQNAKQSLERAYQAGDAATRATASANNAASKATSAIAQIAGLVAALAAVGISIATLKVLGGRMDAQDKRVDEHDNALSKILGLLNPIKSKADGASQTAKDAQSAANSAIYKANNATYESKEAAKNAARASEKANDALYEVRAGRAKLEAQTQEAKKQANDALYVANRANAKAEEALKKAPVPGPRGPQGVPGIKGPQGVPGIKGPQGLPGKDGKEGPRGFPGQQGLPGKDGEPGRTGERGLQGEPGRTGERGLQGEPGRVGQRGLQGEPGPVGAPGKNGLVGVPGIPGIPGIQGVPGIPGKNGVPGIQGPPGIPGRDGKDGKDGKDAPVDKESKDLLKQLNDKVAGIPPLIMAANNRQPLSYEQTVNAAAEGTCRTTAPGGCSAKALDGARNSVNANNDRNTGRILDALNTGGNVIQLDILKKIDNKLGPQIGNAGVGIGGRLQQFVFWQQADRVLAVLTWFNTLHNAYMLSSSLSDTLFSAVDNILRIFAKDVDGQDIDTGNMFGRSIDNFCKRMFGIETWNGIKDTWKKWNRIYQAGANIINSVRSMIDSTRNISEFIAENTGRIGNSLKRFGVVAENAFRWMPENVNAHSIWVHRLQNLQDAASGIEMVTSEMVSIKDNLKELTEQKEEFKKGIESLEPKEDKDNIPVKSKVESDKIVSKSPAIPEIKESDKEADE